VSTVTEPQPVAAPRSDGVRTLAVALVALAVVLAAVAAILAWRVSVRGPSGGSDAPAGYLAGPAAVAAETAASDEARATLTYSYKSLTADFATAAEGLTPRFRASYQGTTAQSVTPLATKYHAVSSAVVVAAGVSALSPDTATVLLFVDQTVRNDRLSHPRLDRSRINVSMVKLNGRWLIDNLSPI
jgi:Mce-associated membrane protein